MTLLPRGLLAMPADIFVVPTGAMGDRWEGCYWHLRGETRDTAKHPTVPRTVPYNRESSSPKC